MNAPTPKTRLPRVIVTGEFSAGKTKLINGLVGQQVLPSNVTSTSLPPVWLIYGNDVSFRVDLDGKVHQVAGIDEVSVHDTLVYVTAIESETLRHMDIIDTPGNSDPNIPPICWERMVGHADMMIWCTGATQAWRQSEKSTVRDLPEELRAQGMLLITQADRIAEEKQQQKLQRRVTRDASQFLSEIRMASLIDDEQVATLRDEIIAMADASEGRPGEVLYAVENARAEVVRDSRVFEEVTEDNDAVENPDEDTSILTAIGVAVGEDEQAKMAEDAAPELAAAADVADAAEAPEETEEAASQENRKVGLELLQVVSKLDKKRSVKRKRSPAMTSLVEALGDQIELNEIEESTDDVSVTEQETVPPVPAEPEPEVTSSRVLWDALIAERQDKDACVEDFIACVDQLFMPKGEKPKDDDVVAAMKMAAARVLSSGMGTDAFVQSPTSSTGT